jgi:hypothetical protein
MSFSSMFNAFERFADSLSITNFTLGVRHGPVDKAPGSCKEALGSNLRPITPKIGSSKVDEQPTGGPIKIRG